MSDDDLTPAPHSGETAEQYRRRVTAAFAAGNITPERTHLRVDLVRAFVIAAGLVVAGVTAATGYWKLTLTIDELNRKLVDLGTTLASKAELAGAKEEARRQTRQLLRQATVDCQRPRAEVAYACKLRLPADDD